MPSKIPPKPIKTMEQVIAGTQSPAEEVVPLRKGEKLEFLPFAKIRPYVGHLFHLYGGERLDDMVSSIWNVYTKLDRYERFVKLSAEYEAEQRDLTSKAAEMQQEVDTYEQDKTDFNSFSVVVRKYVGPTELTSTIINEFIKRIVVHAPDKSSGKRVQKVDIVWNFIGMVDFPNEPQSKETKEKTA